MTRIAIAALPLAALPLAALLALAGCNTLSSDGTPFPNGSPIRGARVDANPAPRGSDAFCRTYARQTAGNQYETNRDGGDSIGSNLFERQRARDAGERAYARCRAGRTG